MTRKLFELAHVESPFVWRSKFALAHKGLAYESERLAFTKVSAGFGAGDHKSVPVLVEEDGREIHDSWAIAEHLESTYSDAPTLFPGGKDRAKSVEAMLGETGFPNFFPLFIKDIWSCVPEADAAYFRQTREARFGTTLEELSANRDERLVAAREALAPLRAELAKASWLHGETPGYGDYIWLAFFAWLKGCATVPPLEEDDIVTAYIQRGFALYDGVATGFPARWTL